MDGFNACVLQGLIQELARKGYLNEEQAEQAQKPWIWLVNLTYTTLPRSTMLFKSAADKWAGEASMKQHAWKMTSRDNDPWLQEFGNASPLDNTIISFTAAIAISRWWLGVVVPWSSWVRGHLASLMNQQNIAFETMVEKDCSRNANHYRLACTSRS